MMQLPVLAAAIASGNPGAAPAAAVTRTERATVIWVSPEPGVAWGILATFMRVTGQSNDRVHHYLLPFLRHGQPRPAVGMTCTFVLRRFDFQGHVGPHFESVDGGEAIARYRCDGDLEEVVTGF